MHLNELSTAALMRRTILASLNLIMGRLVGSWVTLLHPLFFLSMVTIDLGLYALMVHSGTLNKTVIGGCGVMITSSCSATSSVTRSA